MSSSSEIQESKFETVLILQGGGSLGAYECGVFKSLHQHKIRFDVVAGTSIGAVNAAIIAGSKSGDPAKDLEQFWLTLAETITPSFLTDDLRGYLAALNSATWGNPRAFESIYGFSAFNFLYSSPFLYSLEPLKETLQEFVDFNSFDEPDRPRLIVTSTDIQKGKPVIFDSKRGKIEPEHILASAGYPFYGISWTKIGEQNLWDGTLLSNTPLREVIDVSPKHDKKVYLVNLFPKRHQDLPKNMLESWHRARDIMHTDKTEHNVRMSKIITRYLKIIKEMHSILQESNLDEKQKRRFDQMESEYHKLARDRGAIIKEIIRIERQEDKHFLFEDANFSLTTIKKLIEDGQNDAQAVLRVLSNPQNNQHTR